MRWQNCTLTIPLQSGELEIVANPAGENRKLTNANLTEIVTAIQAGIRDNHGALQAINSLKLVQVQYSVTGAEFRNFINGLVQIPHLHTLDFDKDSSYSHQFSAREVRQLSLEIAHAQHLQKLTMRISWGQNNQANQQIVNDLANMLRTNQSLTHFFCDLDDTIDFGYGNYALLRSILATPNQLTNVTLALTSFPEYDIVLRQLIAAHPNINFVFEGNMTLQRKRQEEIEKDRRLRAMLFLLPLPQQPLAVAAPVAAAPAAVAARDLRRRRDDANVPNADMADQREAKRARR